MFISQILRKKLLWLLSAFCLALTVQGGLVQSVRADSPVVIIGRWKFDAATGQNCVKFSWGAADVDTFTRDSLGHEWGPGWHRQSLKAGAVLIRSVAIYFEENPEGANLNASWYCNGTAPFFFNLRSSKMEGYSPGRGATADRGTCEGTPPPCNNPNTQVTTTGGKVLLKNGNLPEYMFNSCLQERTRDLADAGGNYVAILQDPSIYGASRCSGIPLHTGLTVSSAAPHGYTFTDSLTNGTAPYYVQGNQPPLTDIVPDSGQHSSVVTAEGVAREAESYWGMWNIAWADDDRDHDPIVCTTCVYVMGAGRGSKVEYRYSLGGNHQNTIRLSGLDDYPSPVTVNIYVDGKYKFQMIWATGDDARRQINKVIGYPNQYAQGTHAVAIEFMEDLFLPYTCPPGNPGCQTCPGWVPAVECDRNMYLDRFTITNP